MPWFTSEGVNMHVDVSGTGAPLLLLHEVTLDHRQWTPQSEVLRGTYRVFRLDWRGHGKSASSPSGHGWTGFAADAQRALVQVGMDRQHPGTVIAHGYACDAALQLARREPRAVRALVLVAPAIWGATFGDEWNALLAAMRAAAQADDLARALELLRADVAFAGVRADADLERSVRTMQERFSGDWLRTPSADTGLPTAAQLDECKVPILVLSGSRDRGDFGSTAALVAARAPQARLQQLTGAAHFPNLERPEAFNRVLLDFLATLA